MESAPEKTKFQTSLANMVRLLGGPDVLAVPGLVLCGLLLGGLPYLPPLAYLWAFVLALLLHVIASVAGRAAGCCSVGDGAETFFLARFSRVGVRGIALATVGWGCFYMHDFCGPLVLGVLLTFWSFCHDVSCLDNSKHRIWTRRTFFALRYVLIFLLGASASLFIPPIITLNPWQCAIAFLFAVGLFLYYMGIARCTEGIDIAIPKRPGRILFLIGGIVCYSVLFGIVMRKPTQNWPTLLSGAVSAISAAVFVIVIYWCFRVLQYPVSGRECRKWVSLLFFNIFFLQLATMTAFSDIYGFVSIAACMATSVWISRQIGPKDKSAAMERKTKQ